MRNNKFLFLFKINRVIFFVILIIYLSIKIISIIRGSNVIFSENQTFNLTFLLSLILGAFVIVIEKLTIFRKFKNLNEVATNLVFIGIIVGLFVFSIYYGSVSLGYIVRDNLFIAKNLNLSRDEKFSKGLGYIFYNLTKQVTDNTPEDSIIMIAPQTEPYSKTGNVNFFRYFIYPRYAINGELGDNSFDEIDYVLIVRGEKDNAEPERYFWPREKIKAEKVYVFQENGEVYEYIGDYIPSEFNGIGGLIKLEK